MRITNKIIQNNAISNINNNKVLEDQLNTQLSTGSKVSRPSDDPVVAIRALRLRTNLSQVTQYYEKNVPDATSWLSVTEAAVDTTVNILTDMYEQCTKGSVGYDTASDREKILESLEALRDELYSTGDADYAGRYVFTGYRTGTSLSFAADAATAPSYSITEQLSAGNVKDMTYIDTAGLTDVTTSDIGTTQATEVTTNTVHRIRLAYDNCDSGVSPTISYYDADGNAVSVTATVMSVNGAADPYLAANGSASGAVFIPETGELILSDDLFADLQGTLDDATTQDVNEGEIRVTYTKSEFASDDLRPEHYYNCTTTDAEGNTKTYNENFLDPLYTDAQVINYDVGYNQSVRVNTMAKEVYTLDIGRDVDELITSINNVVEMEETIADLEKVLANSSADTTPTATEVQERLTAANKAYDLQKNKLQKDFEGGITSMQGYIDQANKALTAVGNRQARVELVGNRLSSQQTSFKTLTSDNEDVDATEVAVQLSSVELSYQAALMATSKIAQTTLLNYL